MPIDVNLTINPSPALLARLTSIEEELQKMSQSLDNLTAAVAAEEAESKVITTTLGAILAEIQTLKAGGGATPDQLDALSARISAVTAAEAAAVQSVPAEDLPPAPGQNPTA